MWIHTSFCILVGSLWYRMNLYILMQQLQWPNVEIGKTFIHFTSLIWFFIYRVIFFERLWLNGVLWWCFVAFIQFGIGFSCSRLQMDTLYLNLCLFSYTVNVTVFCIIEIKYYTDYDLTFSLILIPDFSVKWNLVTNGRGQRTGPIQKLGYYAVLCLNQPFNVNKPRIM